MIDFDTFTQRLQTLSPVQKIGRVAQVTGLVIEADGPNVGLGDVCEIRPKAEERASSFSSQPALYAEVVGFREHRLLLMPLGEIGRLGPGAEVVACPTASTLAVGPGLIGRILDGLGNPMDGLGPLLHANDAYPLKGQPPNPLRRERIRHPFQTGVRAIDLFTPVGRGQRLGIFAGSGVGKSSLMGMIAKGGEADINVIALIGERGRELREFVEKDLGPAGLARSVVIAATSDQPAPVRLRAALTATAVAEWFRDQGRSVLFMMDSVTRFAMAQREIGLAVGEPPASRGYPPSVFALLPRLLERTGAAERGSITAFYTVLVEGDDMNEPVADTVRGILDGHIVLSRALATANHFPAIDVLESISRLNRDVSTPEQLARVGFARDLMATYRRSEDLISIGAYAKGSNAKLDLAVERRPLFEAVLRQGLDEATTRDQAHQVLQKIVPDAPEPLMKPTPFRLASVLQLYASREDQARARYGEAVRAREFATEALAAAHAELDANTDAYVHHRDSPGFAAASHARHWLTLQEGQARCRSMLDKLHKARFAEAQMQAELVVARRAHESILKLRERHDAEQRREALRHEEHALGDFFNANLARRRNLAA